MLIDRLGIRDGAEGGEEEEGLGGEKGKRGVEA